MNAKQRGNRSHLKQNQTPTSTTTSTTRSKPVYPKLKSRKSSNGPTLDVSSFAPLQNTPPSPLFTTHSTTCQSQQSLSLIPSQSPSLRTIQRGQSLSTRAISASFQPTGSISSPHSINPGLFRPQFKQDIQLTPLTTLDSIPSMVHPRQNPKSAQKPRTLKPKVISTNKAHYATETAPDDQLPPEYDEEYEAQMQRYRLEADQYDQQSGQHNEFGHQDQDSTVSRQKTIQLEPGIDYLSEPQDMEQLYVESYLDSFMDKVMALPLAAMWPRTEAQADQFLDEMDHNGYIPPSSSRHRQHTQRDNDSTGLQQDETIRKPKKLAQFSEGEITATQLELEEQKNIVQNLDRAQGEIADIEVSDNIELLVQAMVQQFSTKSQGDIFSPTTDPKTSKRRHLVTKLSRYGSLSPEDYNLLNEQFPNSTKFLQKLQSARLPPLTSLQALMIDMMIENHDIPASIIARHLNELFDGAEVQVGAIVFHFLQRAFEKGRFGLTNTIATMGLSTYVLTTLDNEMLGKGQNEEQGADDGDVTLLGTPMFLDGKDIRRQRLRQMDKTREQEESPDGDSEKTASIVTPFTASLQIPLANSDQSDLGNIPDNSPRTLSGLTSQTHMSFNHNVVSQHYTLPLHAIINYFKAPAASRNSLKFYEGFPETLEDIVSQGYRLCALLMNPDFKRNQPVAFYSNLPLILTFFLTCQDDEKFQHALLYFQENISDDYKDAIIFSRGLSCNLHSLVDKCPPDVQEKLTTAHAQGGQYGLEAAALESFPGLNPRIRAKAIKDRVRMIESAHQTLELVMTRQFLSKDFTSIFENIAWAESCSLFSHEKVQGYRNRLYAQSDDQSFVSLVTHKLMQLSEKETKKLSSTDIDPAHLKDALDTFYSPLFGVLPPHPTFSSHAALLRQDFGESGVKRITASTVVDSNQDGSTSVQFLSLPKPMRVFLNEILDADALQKSTAQKTRTSAASPYSPFQSQSQSQPQAQPSTPNTIGSLIIQDLNPNVIKVDPVTKRRFVQFPKLITSQETIQFHQIAFKIQHHALKIRARLEQTFPEFAHVGHYDSLPHAPYLTVNGQNHYMTHDIDPAVEQIVHDNAHVGGHPSLSQDEFNSYRQQMTYNHFLHTNIKDLWVKHITPPMFRLLSQEEVGLLHLYSLCEPLIQSTAVTATPDLVRRPPDTAISQNVSQETAQMLQQIDNNFTSPYFHIRIFINSLRNYSDLVFSPTAAQDLLQYDPVNTKGKAVMKFGERSELKMEPSPYIQSYPVLPDQSLLSQFPIPATPTKDDAGRTVIKLRSKKEAVGDLFQDDIAFLTSSNSSVLSYHLNSSLYLLRRTYNNLTTYLNNIVEQHGHVPPEMVHVVTTIFLNAQNTQNELFGLGWTNFVLDTSSLSRLMSRCGVNVPVDPIVTLMSKNKDNRLIVRPINLTTAAEISQERKARRALARTLFQASDKTDKAKINEYVNQCVQPASAQSLETGIDLADDDDALLAELEANDDATIPAHTKGMATGGSDFTMTRAVQAQTTKSRRMRLPCTELDTTDLLSSSLADPNNHNDITSPLTQSEIEIFNDLYERAHYDPERDSIWASQVPVLTRIMSLVDLSTKFGTLSHRPFYSQLITQAHQSSLPDLAIKLMNQQQLAMIPYVAPQVFTPSIVCLLEGGMVADARNLVSKLDLLTTHGGVITTLARLGADAKEYDIPIYFLRSFAEDAVRFVNGEIDQALNPQSKNLFLLTNLLRYALDVAIPESKSTELSVVKFRAFQQGTSLSYLKVPSSNDNELWNQHKFLPAKPSHQLLPKSTQIPADSAHLDPSITAIAAVLELGLELQHNLGFFTLMTETPPIPTNPSKSARLKQFKNSLDITGCEPRSMTRLLIQLVRGAQLLQKPDLEAYFRRLIASIDGEFVDVKGFRAQGAPPVRQGGKVTEDVQSSLKKANVNSSQAGVQVKKGANNRKTGIKMSSFDDF